MNSHYLESVSTLRSLLVVNRRRGEKEKPPIAIPNKKTNNEA